MDIAQGIERTLLVVFVESCAVIPLFPEMPLSVEHAVEAHRRVPVEPVHDLGQIQRGFGFNQVVDVVTHDAKKAVLLLSPFYRVQQHLSALLGRQVKFTVVAANGHMVAVIRLQVSLWTWHLLTSLSCGLWLAESSIP